MIGISATGCEKTDVARPELIWPTPHLQIWGSCELVAPIVVEIS